MSEGEVIVDIIVNKEDVMEKGSELHAILDKVATRWVKLKRLIIREGRAMLRSVHALIGVYRATLKVMGMTIDPMQEIILAYIATTVTTMISISTAMAATGIGATVAVYVLGASLAFNTIATANALLGMNKARAAMDDATALMDSIGLLGTSLTWI